MTYSYVDYESVNRESIEDIEERLDEVQTKYRQRHEERGEA